MFLAHENSLNKDEYLPLEQYNKEKALVKSDGYVLTSNVCPHQGSIISKTIGKGIRQCQYHGWQFNSIGTGITNRQCLETWPVYTWSNLLFSEPVEFTETFDMKDLILMESRVDMVKGSVKNIMDIFLDVDHIPFVHKDVYESIGFETINDVEWSYYDSGSIQRVQNRAMWIAIYPNTMIEWQDGAVFVTVANAVDNKNTKVHVFKYRNKNMSDYDWHSNQLVWERSWAQDREQAELLVGTNPRGLEKAKKHYRTWLENNGLTV